MAAPTFVGAGAGVTIASGSAAVTAAGSGVAVGDLVILQVLQDGTAASAVTYSAISGIANLAGTASSLTTLATDQVCGSTAKQHLRVGRATSTTCSVTVATTGDDLYYRIYVFRGVNSGTALTDILENGTAGTIANGSGATAAVADTGVVTLGADRLALNFVGVDDDNAVSAFDGQTGGTWAVAAEFFSATGTDGSISLQAGYGQELDYLFSSGATYSLGNVAANTARAQSFVAPRTETLATVLLQLAYVGATPADTVIVEIQTDASGSPSGTVVGTPATLTFNALDATIEFTRAANVKAPLTASSTYWIVVRRSGALNASNYYWLYAANDPGYPGGTHKVYSGTAWAAEFSDFAFALATGLTASATINGGSQTMAAADNWGVIGFALKPVPAPSGTAWEQPLADTLSLADSATTQAGKSATIGDTLALADSTAFQAVYARTLTDSLTVADAVAFQRALTQSDTLAVADAIAAQRGIAQAVADTLTLADLAATAAGKGVTLADTLALADAVSLQAAFVRGLADTLSLADTVAAQSAFQLAIVDTLALADALSSQAAFARALADTLTLADLASPVEGEGGVAHTQPVADTLALADSLSSQAAYLRAVADTLTLADLLTTTGARTQAISDTVALADALRFDRTLTLADTLALADAVSFQAAYQRALADTLSLADSVTAGRQLAQALADTFTLLDSLTFEQGRGILLEDTLILADLLAFLQTTPIGGPPLASGHFNFTGRGRITQSATGEYTGRGHRGRITGSSSRSLAQTTKGTS